MPFDERPPNPPERHHNRQLIIALLVYLANRMLKKGDRNVLLFAPVKQKDYNSTEHASNLSPVDLLEVYTILRSILNKKINEDPEKRFFDTFSNLLSERKHITESSHSLNTVLSLVKYPPQDLFDEFFQKKELIKDASFVKRFGYDCVIRGKNSEVLELTPSSGIQALYLGMTVRYAKKYPSSGYTGPLRGEGRIISFHIPKIGPTADQAVELSVTDGKTISRTRLSPDELFFE